MKTKFKTFARGSAVFICECCGRRTRETGPDHAHCDLCEECYEMGGIENQGADEGWTPALKVEWDNLNMALVAKGGRSQSQPWED